MSEAVQNPVKRPAYVAPPATLPVPAVMPAHLTPEPEPEPVTTPLTAAPLQASSLPTAPPPVSPPPVSPSVILSVPTPVLEPGPKGGIRRLVGLVAVVLVLLVGVGVGVSIGRNSTDQPNAGGTQGSATDPVTTREIPLSTPPPTVAAPPPTTSAPDRPVIPEQALTLTDQEALDELNRQITNDASQVASFAGAWLPQVSSKCVGISVDIGPQWIPDGVDDTAQVSLQQILAFHIAVHNRFNAVLLLPTQAGLPRDQASAGPCAGSMVWMSAVPSRFATAADANAWCTVNVTPVRECGARYFAGPGGQPAFVLRD